MESKDAVDVDRVFEVSVKLVKLARHPLNQAVPLRQVGFPALVLNIKAVRAAACGDMEFAELLSRGISDYIDKCVQEREVFLPAIDDSAWYKKYELNLQYLKLSTTDDRKTDENNSDVDAEALLDETEEVTDEVAANDSIKDSQSGGAGVGI